MSKWIVFIFFTTSLLQAQIDSTLQAGPFPKKISAIRTITFSSVFLASVGGLYAFADDAYYQDEQVPFHWARHTDGSLDWFDNYYRGIDKFGHVFSTSLFSDNFYFLARWSGYSKTSSSWMAFGSSVSVLTAMEIWDAHFEDWGFSPGDFTANVLGATFSAIRPHSTLLQAFNYKLSYNFFASKSPDHSVHDYEHMTFWLSMNPLKLFSLANISLPKGFSFLNLALGFGINRARPRQQEIYIGLDFNLETIPIKNIYLRHILKEMNRFHLPAPAIRIAPGYIGYGLFF